MKILSVVIPMYNTEKGCFKKCLKSLECSRVEDIELIVVDDGSKEENSIVIKNLVEESKLDSFYFRKENGGQNSARLYGMKKATGKYIFFVDADDYLETKYLDDILQLLIEKNPSILAFNYDVRTPDGKIIEEHERWKSDYQSMDVTKGILNSDSLCLQIYNLQVLRDNKIELAQGIRIGEDFASAITILATIEQAYTVGGCLYHYIKYPGSTLSNPPLGSELDIVKAFDFILKNLDTQKKKAFHQELEWLAILHVLYYGTERIMMFFSGNRNDITKIQTWINHKFPHWKNNYYLKILPMAKKLEFKMVINGWILPIEIYRGIKILIKKMLKN